MPHSTAPHARCLGRPARRCSGQPSAPRAALTVCMILRTAVTDQPRSTRVSAIQPPTFAATAMVIHGSTEYRPELRRSRPST